MLNYMTYRLRLIEEQYVRGLPLIGHMIYAVEGFSQEIFRENTLITSVRSPGVMPRSTHAPVLTQKRVHNGDIIFHVNLTPQPCTIAGVLTTKDQYNRAYEITLELVVSDPALFVQEYRQRYDPVKLTIATFKNQFQLYATKTDYDQVSSEKLVLDQCNEITGRDHGMKVKQAYSLVLQDDPKRSELLTIQRQADIDMTKARAMAQVKRLEDEFKRELTSNEKAHARWEDVKQKNFNREEETRQEMHRLHMVLRRTAADELAEILRERIRDTFERGKPISEVAAESLKLLNAFHESLQQDGVVDSIPITEYNLDDSEEKDNGPDTTMHGIFSEEDLQQTKHDGTSSAAPGTTDGSGKGHNTRAASEGEQPETDLLD